MKTVVQRVKEASLSVDGKLVSKIGKGLCVYLGVERGDTQSLADYLSKKIYNIRIFEDEDGKMNVALKDIGGEILVISQFTLCADATGGNRPSFALAEDPAVAEKLYEYFVEKLVLLGARVKTGVFGADMQIVQHNDGPVTIELDKRP